MSIKKILSSSQRFGLSQSEISAAENYVRKNPNSSVMDITEAAKLYELFLLGYSLSEIQQSHPQYSLGQLAFTAAMRGWASDKEKMMGSLKERVQARVVKSVLEQLDFLSTMLSVANVEHLQAMRQYIEDPVSNPPPKIKIDSIKDYKEVVLTLSQLTSGMNSNSSNSKNKKLLDSAVLGSHEVNSNESKQDKAARLAKKLEDRKQAPTVLSITALAKAAEENDE